MNLHDDFILQMKNLFLDEYNDFYKAITNNDFKGLRVNTLKLDKKTLKALLDFETKDVDWCNEGLYFEQEQKPSKSFLYNAGLFYIQEPSAMLTASILNIEQNDIVLDMCSAPGGKTTQIAQKLNHTGFIISNDISATRQKAVIKNIELLGIENCAIISESPEKLTITFPNFFDKIIVDAPCSGEGMFKSNNDVLNSWSPNCNKQYFDIQTNLLDNATKLLKDGGEIIYSTCTFSTLENEYVIKKFLDTHKNFDLIPISHDKLCISKGFLIEDDTRLLDTARILPHKSNGNGHFVAYLKNKNKKTPKLVLENTSSKNINYFIEFCQNNFYSYDYNNIVAINEKLYKIPKIIFEKLKGIRVLRSGLYLGDLKTKRFEPSQAFAMTLKKSNCKNFIDYNIKSANLKRYLNGESYEETCIDGYCLVGVCGYPLGFGKMQNNRLKNKYFKGWRIQK